MPSALIGLGANEGDRRATLAAAVESLAAELGIAVIRQSDWRETAPVGGPPGQQPFLNSAVRVDASLSAHDLLELLLRIEDQLGRRRAVRWGPRIIDLDLLLYDELILTPNPSDANPLELPHPRMEFRRFVLAPAVEAASDMVHPTTGWTVAELWRHLNEAKPSVALTGANAVKRQWLARHIRQALEDLGAVTWPISETWLSDSTPKLLIAIAPADEERPAFVRYIRSCRNGPLLIVPGDDDARSVEEAVAALLAMA